MRIALIADIHGNLEALRAVLADAGLPPLVCQGAYFLLSDVTPHGFDNDVDFCRYLVTEAGVAAIPPSAFYLDPTHVRPVHPEFLRFATERCGFVQVGVEFANAAADAADAGQEVPATTPQLRELVGHVDWALFGPQDYAVFGIKPDPEG